MIRAVHSLPGSRRRPGLARLLLALLAPAQVAALVLAPAAAGAPVAAPVQPTPMPGKIVDPVSCVAEPELSYALYVPPGYTPERTWPALFILDARGRGAQMAERFRPAAERYGWILVSSNDSSSDKSWDDIQRPAAAMLADAPRRVRIDPRRVYLAGFSGTARGAVAIAAAAEGGVTGVLAAGGGFPSRLEPSAELPFSFFGAAGTRDFNFQEMQTLWDALDAAGAAHRLTVFDGPHAWPPAAVIEQVLGWFEVDAMRRGLRPMDGLRALTWADEEMARWQAAEAAGDPWSAWAGFRALAADLGAGRGELVWPRAVQERAERAAAETRRLDGSKQLAKARSLRSRLARWEAEQRAETSRVLGPIGSFETLPPPDTRQRGEKLVRSLSAAAARRPAGGSATESWRADAAERALASFRSHAAFYLPRDLFARSEYHRAALALELAVAASPSSVRSWYDLGCARARLGRKPEALEALEKAVDLGFSNADHLLSDPDLESLRDDERFRALAASLGAAKAADPGRGDES